MILPIGPLINALAIAVGALAGMALGSRLPERVRTIVFQGLGLCILVTGMQMAFVTKSPVILIFSVLLGGVAGELLRLEERFMALGDRLKRLLKSGNPRFTEGLVNTTVLVCIGAMAIVGSFDEGLRGDRTVVFSKAVMDGFAALALASAYGLGVAFAAVPLLLYQGLLMIGAGFLKPWMSPALMNELTATGGVLILGIAFNLLNLTQIRLSNLLPSLLVVVVLALIFLPA